MTTYVCRCIPQYPIKPFSQFILMLFTFASFFERNESHRVRYPNLFISDSDLREKKNLGSVAIEIICVICPLWHSLILLVVNFCKEGWKPFILVITRSSIAAHWLAAWSVSRTWTHFYERLIWASISQYQTSMPPPPSNQRAVTTSTLKPGGHPCWKLKWLIVVIHRFLRNQIE